jgi:hypothetical protein
MLLPTFANQMASDIKVNTRQNVVTASKVEWLDPYDPLTPPPRGAHVDVLTWGGIKTDAIWTSDAHLFFAAWCPKPSKPDWLKERMRDHYVGAFIPTSI